MVPNYSLKRTAAYRRLCYHGVTRQRPLSSSVRAHPNKPMELIYSTNVLSDAQRLSSLLTEAGLLNHVSGVNAARLPGFLTSFDTPSSIGVWLASPSELSRARRVMLSAGFMEQASTSPPSAWLSSSWFIVAVAALVAILVAIAAYGP